MAEGNFFIGGGETTSGGVRLQGRDQLVVNNYFQDLGRFAVGMMDGTPDDLYVRVERAKIAHNTVIDCGNALVVGINHSLHPNGTVPKDCLIANNLFLDQRVDPSPFVDLVKGDEPENWTWTGNIYSGELGMAPIDDISQLDPQLDFGQAAIALPTADTPLVDALANFPETENDLFGALRNSQTSAGAIQFSENFSVSGPLTAAEVGPLGGIELIMEADAALTSTSAHPLNPNVYVFSPEGFTATWSQVNGPATTFADPSSHVTTVALPTEGVYVLRLTVNNGTESVSKDITLTVSDVSVDPNLTSAALVAVDSIVGDSQVNGPAPGYYVADNGSTIGGTGSDPAETRTDYNIVYRFALPTLPEGEVPSGFSLSFQITGFRDHSNDDYALHAYLLDVADPSTSGTDLFYHGPNDSSHAFVGSHFEFSGSDTDTINLDPPVDVTLTIDSGPALELLQSYYSGHEPNRAEAALRFNLNQLYTGSLSSSALNRYILNNPAALEIQSVQPISGSTITSYAEWIAAFDLGSPIGFNLKR